VHRQYRDKILDFSVVGKHHKPLDLAKPHFPGDGHNDMGLGRNSATFLVNKFFYPRYLSLLPGSAENHLISGVLSSKPCLNGEIGRENWNGGIKISSQIKVYKKRSLNRTLSL
jgi:hypothetical protein